MVIKVFPLHKLPIGQKAKIKTLTADDNMKRRMLDLGLISDTLIEPLQRSPLGDPVAYFIRGAVIALRIEEASKIFVEVL